MKLTVAMIFMGVILAFTLLPQTSCGSISKGGRNLLQENVSKPLTQSDETVRIDPLDGFKKYRGGYDLTNKHYWSSTIYSGVYGYAIGVVWLLCGVVYGGFVLVTTFCCNNSNRNLKKKKKRSYCHNNCYLWPIILSTIFTLLAITATGIVLGGNGMFHSRAKKVVDIIIDTADEASVTIYNTTGAMNIISINLESSNENDASDFLTTTSHQLNSEADNIQSQAKKNRQVVDKGLQLMYILTTFIISFNLVALIALSVCGVLRFKRALYMLIILCWLLTVICWLCFGIYFFIEKFAGDTCSAIEDFQRDPNNSSLSSILPCDELLPAKSLISDISAGIYDLVDKANAKITMVQICNPFSGPPEYNYQPHNCPEDSIPIGDIPRLMKIISCVNDNTCIGGIPISQEDYNTVVGYTSSIQELLYSYPGMESLVECQTVRDALSEILHKQCKPLKTNVRMVWSSMVILSVLMVALVLIWTTEAHHDHTYHSSDGSVKPHSASTDVIESQTNEWENIAI